MGPSAREPAQLNLTDPGGSPVYVPRVESDDEAPSKGSGGRKKRKLGGPRASIACKSCRKRKIRCSADWPTCALPTIELALTR